MKSPLPNDAGTIRARHSSHEDLYVEPARVSFGHLGETELAIVSYPISAMRLGSVLEMFTDAEGDVLAHILSGERTTAIAAARGTSTSTVKKQIRSLFRRLGVTSRAELVTLFGGNR